MKIDQINAVILKELLMDARKSFTDIAQISGESKEVIANRFRQMQKQGIIVGATTQNSCACYDSNFAAAFHIYTRTRNPEEAVQLLKTFPNIIEVYPAGINPNLNTVFTIKSIAELEQTRQALKELPDALDVETEIWVGMRNNPHNLSLLNNGEPLRIEDLKVNPKREDYPQIDEIDRAIHEKLVVDSRMAFSRIASELGISTDTVSKRYERLKLNNHIKSVIRINPKKIGYNAFALFRLSFSEDSLNSSIDAISVVPDFNFMHKISGKYDCWASLMVKDINQLTSVQEQILEMEHLTNMEVSVSKLFCAWPLPREFTSTF